jgi:hypothetical protein
MTGPEKENRKVIEAELKEGGFVCCGCGRRVEFSDLIGTKHRNHCPTCLSSKHLDDEFSGDRAAKCGGCMSAVGLTMKEEGVDKYGHPKKGELMIVHRCNGCGKVSINRLAADDEEREILKVFVDSMVMGETERAKFLDDGIRILKEEDKQEVYIRLFGKGGYFGK